MLFSVEWAPHLTVLVIIGVVILIVLIILMSTKKRGPEVAAGGMETEPVDFTEEPEVEEPEEGEEET